MSCVVVLRYTIPGHGFTPASGRENRKQSSPNIHFSREDDELGSWPYRTQVKSRFWTRLTRVATRVTREIEYLNGQHTVLSMPPGCIAH